MEKRGNRVLLEMSRKTLTLHLSKRMDMTLRIRKNKKKKKKIRVEDFAVDDAAVATGDEFDGSLPQRVGDGVLDKSLAVEIESENASGELAHIKVLEVDEEQPHHQKIPRNHRPAHAYASSFTDRVFTVLRTVQLAHVVDVVGEELREQHARAPQHVHDLRVQIQIPDGLEPALLLLLALPRGFVALKLLLVDVHRLLVHLARVDPVPAEQTRVRRFVPPAHQSLLHALAASFIHQIHDHVHVRQLQRRQLAPRVPVGEPPGEGVVEGVEVVSHDVVDVHRGVRVLRIVVVVVDVVKVVVIEAKLVRILRRRRQIVVEHYLVRPQHKRRRNVRHHR